MQLPALFIVVSVVGVICGHCNCAVITSEWSYFIFALDDQHEYISNGRLTGETASIEKFCAPNNSNGLCSCFNEVSLVLLDPAFRLFEINRNNAFWLLLKNGEVGRLPIMVWMLLTNKATMPVRINKSSQWKKRNWVLRPLSLGDFRSECFALRPNIFWSKNPLREFVHSSRSSFYPNVAQLYLKLFRVKRPVLNWKWLAKDLLKSSKTSSTFHLLHWIRWPEGWVEWIFEWRQHDIVLCQRAFCLLNFFLPFLSVADLE